MKGAFYAVLFFFLFFLSLTSVIMTIADVVNGRYLKEINNIKSLNNRDTYMTVDSLLIQKLHYRNEATGDGIRFDIEGVLKSNNSRLRLSVWFPEYIDLSLKYQPVYKSKLTGDYYVKDADQAYYNGQYRELYFAILLKIAFFFIVPFLIYHLIKYIKNRKYRI